MRLYIISIITILPANVIVYSLRRYTPLLSLPQASTLLVAISLFSFSLRRFTRTKILSLAKLQAALSTFTLFINAYILDAYNNNRLCLPASIKPCLLNDKIISRQPTIFCWLYDNRAHPKCADLGHSAGLVADRTKSNMDLDWTCPSCHHIKVNIMAFIRQTVLEYQSLSAGFKDLSDRFLKAESNYTHY